MVRHFIKGLCHNAFSDFVRQGVNLTNGTGTLNKHLVLFEKKRHERHIAILLYFFMEDKPMKKKIKKWVCILLAVVLLTSTLPLIAGALAPSAGSVQGISSSGGPLKVEIKPNKDKYTLLGKIEFTATITNTSSSTVENISAQALLGASLRPLKNGSQFTATKASLAPNESFSFKYTADLNGLKGLDNLLLPLFWISSLAHGGKADIGTGTGGADYVEASKAVGLVSLFAGQYDASTAVRVYHGGGTGGGTGTLEDEIYDFSAEDISTAESGARYLNNVVSIYFMEESTAEERLAVVNSINGEVVGHIDYLCMLQVKLSRRTLSEIYELCNELKTLEAVSLAVPEEIHDNTFFQSVCPTDPWSDSLPNWDDINKSTEGWNWWLKFVKAPSAWLYDEYMQTSFPDDDYRSIKVGIIDSGFDTEHEDLTVNFINKENEKKNYHQDHGTQVAGIIGANWNDKGINGIVPQSSIWGYSVADEETKSWSTTEIYKGLKDLVQSGCKIINLSGGCSEQLANSTEKYSDEERDTSGYQASEVIGRLLEKEHDFLVVQSAGNGAKNKGESREGLEHSYLGIDAINNKYFSSITEQHCYSSNKVSSKAIMDRVIIVTACKKDYSLPAFANGGKKVDIVAPGFGVYSTLSNNQYDDGSGTSLSAPIVAGIAKLVWSINPTFKADQVKNIVCTSYDTSVRITPNAVTPPSNGYRLVNAERAVLKALEISNIAIGEINSPVNGYLWSNDAEYGYVPNVTVNVYKAGTTEKVDYTISNQYGYFSLFLGKGSYELEFIRAGYLTPPKAPLPISETKVYYLGDITLQADGTGTHLFDGGTGTEVDPYLLSTPAHLDAVRNNLTAHYKLTYDIDLADQGNWEPIGSLSAPFTGVFDGDGYAIKNMTININNNDSELCAGLFGCLDTFPTSTIKNIGMVNSAINITNNGDRFASAYVGGIAGMAFGGVIYNCYSTGEIVVSMNGSPRVGGIVGQGGTIKNCRNIGTINAISTASSYTYAGGIAGHYFSSITNCYNAGTINATTSSDAFAGGIAADNNYGSSTITNCYNLGAVNATSDLYSYAGGIVGENGGSTSMTTYAINNCYNIGKVKATASASSVGGIIGINSYPAWINNCYSLNNNVLGSNYGTFTNVHSLTEPQMKQQASFVGFDFTDTWAINPAINNGYPYLRGMQP